LISIHIIHHQQHYKNICSVGVFVIDTNLDTLDSALKEHERRVWVICS